MGAGSNFLAELRKFDVRTSLMRNPHARPRARRAGPRCGGCLPDTARDHLHLKSMARYRVPRQHGDYENGVNDRRPQGMGARTGAQRVPYLSISFDDAQERMFTIESKYAKGIVRQGGAGNKLLFVCSNWRDPKPGSKIPVRPDPAPHAAGPLQPGRIGDGHHRLAGQTINPAAHGHGA